MQKDKARLASRLLYSYDIYRDEDGERAAMWLEAPPPTRDKIANDHLRDDKALKEYLAIAPKLGPALDANGIDRMVTRMIDAASEEGGPILRDGNKLLPGSAGPRLSGTPTERAAHLLLYHADRGLQLHAAESQNLWERQNEPIEGVYRSVLWVHERIGGSLTTLYDALRSLAAKNITEQRHGKRGLQVRLRVPFTFQAAEDRAMYCYLRDEGLLPVTRKTVIPGETPRALKALNWQWLADMVEVEMAEEGEEG
jgi:hypothetical protein